jgi:anti-sigma factor RsiW
MSDKPSNFELDELLSAYLDGELSEGERAEVEARLAIDPAAQQMLHELQSASQSVQALPTESLGRDMSEEIMRRAREAKPELVRESQVVRGSTGVVRGSPDPAPAPDRTSPASTGSTIPKIRIFHSRRAWIWASLTLAAGLLLMIIQSGDESANKLTPVATRNPEATPTQLGDESGQARRREISISAAPKSLSQSPPTVAADNELREKLDAPATAMPAAKKPGEGTGGRLITRDGSAATPPVAAASPSPKQPVNDEAKIVLNAGDASSTSTASSGPAMTDKLAPAAQPTDRLGGIGGGGEMQAGKGKTESVSGQNLQPLIVVRVVAKPDALKNGAFERLLANNKIEFESQPAKNESRSFGGLLTKPAQTEGAFKEQSNRAAENRSDEKQMVLVEAPAPAIESFLAGLNKNSNDFLSITVREQPQSLDRFDADSTTKKLSETTNGLSRFSRGSTATAQKDAIDPRYYFHEYDFDEQNEPAANGSPRGGSFGHEADNKKQAPPDIRRARRIEPWAIENPQPGEVASATGHAVPTQSSAQTTNQPMSQGNSIVSAKTKAGSNTNDLKVLFVITSEETSTPTPPPNDRQK